MEDAGRVVTDYKLLKLRLLESTAWNVVNADDLDPAHRMACLEALLNVLNERDADGTPWAGRTW